jgi:hypothetical protein
MIREQAGYGIFPYVSGIGDIVHNLKYIIVDCIYDTRQVLDGRSEAVRSILQK